MSDNGHVLTRDSETILNIEFNGNGIETGTVEIKNGKVVKIRNTMIQGYYVKIVDGEVTIYNKLPESKIVTGSSFNSLIKTLVNGKSNSQTYYSDTVVTNIEFLPNEKIPIGYTEETLLDLDSVDVSLKEDGSILALYDGNGTVYVYSKNKIKSNEDLSSMFQNFTKLTNIDFEDFDTSDATSMNAMFYNCKSLISLDVSKFDTIKVTNMNSMFWFCKNIATLNLSKFDTSKVENMNGMFAGCSSLTNLDLRIADFNNVTSYTNMFYSAPSSITITVRNGTVGDKTTQEWIQERLGVGKGTIIVDSKKNMKLTWVNFLL